MSTYTHLSDLLKRVFFTGKFWGNFLKISLTTFPPIEVQDHTHYVFSTLEYILGTQQSVFHMINMFQDLIEAILGKLEIRMDI